MIVVRGCSFPQDRLYHVEYNVWLKEEGPDTVVLGATSFGVALAVEFVAFIPKPAGTAVEAGRAIGLLELMKTLVSVRTPVAATVSAANAAAVADPALIAADPYGAGWLVKLSVERWPPPAADLLSGAEIAPAFERAMHREDFKGLQP